MTAPQFLFLVSFAGVIAAFAMPGWSDLLLVAGPAALASLYLLITARRPRQEKGQVILDGSNVMHWRDETPNLTTVLDVVSYLTREGLEPGVVFDANAGYLLFGKYTHDDAFSRALGLPQDRVMVVPKGTPADPIILTAARDLGARIVTNDRYRDWVEDFPEIKAPGLLVPGGYRHGALWLGLEHAPEKPAPGGR